MAWRNRIADTHAHARTHAQHSHTHTNTQSALRKKQALNQQFFLHSHLSATSSDGSGTHEQVMAWGDSILMPLWVILHSYKTKQCFWVSLWVLLTIQIAGFNKLNALFIKKSRVVLSATFLHIFCCDYNHLILRFAQMNWSVPYLYFSLKVHWIFFTKSLIPTGFFLGKE